MVCIVLIYTKIEEFKMNWITPGINFLKKYSKNRCLIKN